MVNVRESIVSEVVTYGRHAYRKHVHFTEVSEAYHASVLQELVAHLEDVKGMHVIVILNVAPVSFVDLSNEARQLGLVHLRQLIYAKILEDVERDHRQRRFSAHVATKAQCVEIHVLDLLQDLSIILNIVLYSVEARCSTLGRYGVSGVVALTLIHLLYVCVETGLAQVLKT